MTILLCVLHDHDLRLVALSALICALGCLTTVSLLARGAPGSGPSLRWILAAGTVFGSSVWSLHFVAMLAYRPELSISYGLSLTILSVVIAAGGAMLSFALFRFARRTVLRVFLGGALLGLSVAGMHYTGEAAMALPGVILIDPFFVALSLVISVAFGVLALARATALDSLKRRAEIASWMALGICGLHFTGMTALSLLPGPPDLQAEVVLGSRSLALVVGAVSVAILIASLAATLVGQHLSERTVRELKRMRVLNDLAHEGLVIHSDGVVVEVNRAGSRLLGEPAEAVIGRSILALFDEESRPRLMRRSTCAPQDLLPEEVVLLSATGTAVQVELSCRSIDFEGRPATAVALRDLTARKRDEARIRHLVHHDALTNLPNRFLLEDRLKQTLQAAATDGSTVAVLHIDLDRFKTVNDGLGHAAGDVVLQETGQRISALTDGRDTLARVGGDEFILVMGSVPAPDRASALASRVIDALRQPFLVADQPLELGATVGLALYPADAGTPEALLRAADTAMRRAKTVAPGSWAFFEASTDAALQARQQLEHELRHADERGELVLYFQPLVNGRTGETESFEALIRWQHPIRGLLPPADFIALAEQTDIIARLGAWALDAACSAAASWPEPWSVAVNVSPRQFSLSDVPALVEAALARHALAPHRLVIEITEGVFIDDAAQAVAILSGLRRLGVQLALDDFGTGYSSLSYLQLFRFDKIKLDRSFTARLEQGGDATTIIKAMITLGQNLDLAVTVEGVETPQQMALLRHLGCDQMQGYLFGRPAPFAPSAQDPETGKAA